MKSDKQFSIDDNVDTEEVSSNSTISNEGENIQQESTDCEMTNSNEETESSKNNEKEEEDKEEAVHSKVTISSSNESINSSADKNCNNNNESINDTKKFDNNIEEDEDEDEFVFSTLKNIEILSTLIHNMFLVGIVVGFIHLAITSKVCTFLYQLMTLLSNFFLHFSLFSVGAYLSSQSLISCNWMVFLFSLFGRSIVGPVLAGVFCYALKFHGLFSWQSCTCSPVHSHCNNANACDLCCNH